MKNILKPKEMSELLGVSVRTLQRWDKESKLTAYRNPSGRRYYTKEQYESYMGIQKENKVGKTVIYTRVSNSGQKDDLANQVEFLKQFANARGLIVDEIITDIGSGLNYNNINELHSKTNISMFHSSCKTWKVDLTTIGNISYSYSPNNINKYDVTSLDLAKKFVKSIHNLKNR